MPSTTNDRTWPAPQRPWAIAMRWHDLLFAHWPVPLEEIRPLVPPALEVETYQGEAWLGVVPFHMTGVRPRLVPSLPWMSSFAELNVRTYVTAEGKPGVWFFSLDAANPLAVWCARRAYHLPYYRAQISVDREPDESIAYRSTRVHRGGGLACFRGTYAATGPVFHAEPGSLDHWLTARYCLYAAGVQGRVYRGDIDHAPWPLQPAEAEIVENTMTDPLGIRFPDTPPRLCFSRLLDAVAWTLEEVGQRGC